MPVIRFRYALRILLLLAGCNSYAAAFALSPPDTMTEGFETGAPQNHLRYDQLSARVPRALAPIASVAVARVNIAVHQAKQLTEQRLCAGRWTPQGAIRFEVGPRVSPPRGADPGNWPWAYESFREPEQLSCGEISRARYFQELSRYLPEWIVIRPGGQAAAFRQGNPVASN